ncbi:hypothetical protein GWI33_000950 [Rhynchophorus ferrugineus]|uniref:Uncharacterized protein n=1 Tax=Rhynchophorus ferrugineus TaxID=354439 RepID=A0A834MLX8_RHYFE|nr:hypothetical protein GWI33_000950 [Rhynchophorus ferrugineus]
MVIDNGGQGLTASRWLAGGRVTGTGTTVDSEKEQAGRTEGRRTDSNETKQQQELNLEFEENSFQSYA